MLLWSVQRRTASPTWSSSSKVNGKKSITQNRVYQAVKNYFFVELFGAFVELLHLWSFFLQVMISTTTMSKPRRWTRRSLRVCLTAPQPSAGLATITVSMVTSSPSLTQWQERYMADTPRMPVNTSWGAQSLVSERKGLTNLYFGE